MEPQADIALIGLAVMAMIGANVGLELWTETQTVLAKLRSGK